MHVVCVRDEKGMRRWHLRLAISFVAASILCDLCVANFEKAPTILKTPQFTLATRRTNTTITLTTHRPQLQHGLGKQHYPRAKRERSLSRWPSWDSCAAFGALNEEGRKLFKKSGVLCVRGGAAVSTKKADQTARAKSRIPWATSVAQSTQLALFVGTVFFILALSIVSLYPAPNLVALFGSAYATKSLATASSAGALTEIAISPLVGALVDSIGRKPVVLVAMLFVASAYAIVATFSSGILQLPLISAATTAATSSAPSVTAATSSIMSPALTAVLLVGCKYVGSCVVGFFFLAASAILADIHRSDPKALSSSMAVLFSLVNLGFGVGVSLSGLLPRDLPVPYTLATTCALLGATAVALGVPETLPAADRKAFDSAKVQRALLSPLSFLRLLRAPARGPGGVGSGRRLRRFAILTALHSQPIFMGDVMQVFVTSEWGLRKSQVVELFSILAFTGVVSNIAAATGALTLLGLRGFTALATASNFAFWITMSLDFPRAIAGAVVGFLGPARGIVSSASLANEGGKLGISQGQIAGDRSNLFAILKVSQSLFCCCFCCCTLGYYYSLVELGRRPC